MLIQPRFARLFAFGNYLQWFGVSSIFLCSQKFPHKCYFPLGVCRIGWSGASPPTGSARTMRFLKSLQSKWKPVRMNWNLRRWISQISGRDIVDRPNLRKKKGCPKKGMYETLNKRRDEVDWRRMLSMKRMNSCFVGCCWMAQGHSEKVCVFNVLLPKMLGLQKSLLNSVQWFFSFQLLRHRRP